MIFKLMAQFPLTTEVASTLEQEIVECYLSIMVSLYESLD